ncbi:MAG: DUF1572 family protein [Pedobacter sp.]|uniref:DUF1572 family protein n=1 Tax=Pedobacter sp. TaxID=1411316 RepID=UPI002807BD39|nr:DUF1572 family protein [Pedobacter sp.]MDQ8003434.1 DUF1572 family protein [Pedobacter sp.]
MLNNTLIELFERDLTKVVQELELYKSEMNIWKVENGIANSAGNLVLHLIGNLNTYIGKEIGKTDYVRNRELEFSQKDVPRTNLIAQVKNTLNVVKKSLTNLTAEDLSNKYPLVVLDAETTTEFFLVHLFGHLNYHLGQINYHRRMIEG